MKHTFSDLFSVKARSRAVSQGSVLVAEPLLGDLCFRRSVVSIADRSDQGVVGIVFNIKSNFTLGEIFPRLSRGRDIRVYSGGPVALDRVYFAHSMGDRLVPGAVKIGRDLWVGGDFDKLLEYIDDGVDLSGMVRFFIGYASWDRGQLEDEIAQSVWAVSDEAVSGTELLSSPDNHLWHKMVTTLGPAYKVWALHPDNANDN
jgi:putative transcriptional regulator